MRELEGKSALVTGGSRGIGFAIAKIFVREGARVAVTGRSLEAAEEAARSLGGDAMPLALVVSERESVAEAVKKVCQAWGGIDILVNNAGVTRDNLALMMKADEWREVIETNLTGAFLCAKECLRPMMKARRGSIINISSVVGGLGNPGQANYCASKAGLEGLTRSLAREYANRGIRVNAVAPGFIATDMTDALGEKARESLTGQIPLARLGTPEDVAEVVAFLASDRASYVTGAVVHVNGGMYMG